MNWFAGLFGPTPEDRLVARGWTPLRYEGRLVFRKGQSAVTFGSLKDSLPALVAAARGWEALR